MKNFPTPDNPRYAEELYSIYEYFRENDPIHRESILNETGYSLFKYEDVYATLKNKSVGSTGISEELIATLKNNGQTELADFARASNIMITLDDPEHTRVRKVLHEPIRSITQECMSEKILMIVENLLNNLKKSETIDLMKDFADPLPFLVIANFLGVPEEDYTKLKKWAEEFALVMDTSRMMNGLVTIGRTVKEIHDYLYPIIESRIAEPRDDLITALAIARYEKKYISDAELIACFF